jgi:protoporphyrinogen oxidase
MKKMAIIGGGFSALNLAWRLINDFTADELTIDFFDKNPQLGGMAGGFKEKNWAWTLENHYHHLFAKDVAFQELLKSLGLEKQLFFKKTITSTRWHGKNYQLDSALSLLAFQQLSLLDRLRTGLVFSFFKNFTQWSIS